MRLLRAARRWILWLIPCDVTDFARRFSSLRHNEALLLMAALIKEPNSVAVMLAALESTQGCDPEKLAVAMITMLQKTPSQELDVQLKQLNRQGVARFLGSASTCRSWGIIQVVDEKPAKGARKRKADAIEPTQSEATQSASALAATQGEDEDMKLGLCRRPYRATNDVSDLAKLAEFARSHPWPRTDIKDAADFARCVARVKAWDNSLSEACEAWREMPGYVHAFLRRKFVLGEFTLASAQGVVSLDWAQVSIETIKLMVPDSHKVLDVFPASWSAEDLSVFCFDRCDWAVFVALFGCLFQEVVDKVNAEPDELISLVGSEAFGEDAKAHYEKHGIAQHPYNLVSSFGPPEKWPIAEK